MSIKMFGDSQSRRSRNSYAGLSSLMSLRRVDLGILMYKLIIKTKNELKMEINEKGQCAF